MRPARAVVSLTALVLATSCGASPTSQSRESHADRPAAEPDTGRPSRAIPDELRAWDPPPPGEYLLAAPFLNVASAVRHTRRIRLTEPRVARLDAAGEARIQLGGREWVLHGVPSLCSREPTVFEGDDLRWEVPAGTPLRVVGVDAVAGIARVGPGSTADPSVLVARDLLSVESCRDDADAPRPEASAAVPAVPSPFSPCLFSAPSQGGFRVPLVSGWPMRVLAQQGAWRRVAILAGGGTVSGWLPSVPEQTGDEQPQVERSLHRTTEAVTMHGLTLAAGSLVELEVKGQGQHTVAWGEVDGVDVELLEHLPADETQPIASDVLQPAPDAEPPRDEPRVPGLGPASCWYPDATPPDAVPRPAVDGAGEIRGALRKSAIREVVRRHIAEVRHCYERTLAHHEFQGRVVMTWIIAPTGQVQSVTVADGASDAGRHPYLDRCLAREISRWVFPTPQGGGIVVVNYPFQLTSAP